MFRVLTAFVCLSLLFGCDPKVEPVSSAIEPEQPIGDWQPANQRISMSDSTILFEGLPHQGWEPELLERELESKETLEIGDYPFYEETLTLVVQDEQELKTLLSNADNFAAWIGEKACGGFHPDYALRFERDDIRTDALICFNCDEIRFEWEDNSVLVDMRPETEEAVERILKPYRKNRPPVEQREGTPPSPEAKDG